MAASSNAVGEGEPPHKAGVEAVPPQPAAFPVDQALSLLLVDSKPEATAPLLQQSGYRVTAVSCLDAVAQQLSSSQHPDMIVCDWQQGGAGQLLSRLKSRPDWSSIPVVVMSTEAAPAAVIAAMRAGAADFLVQPLRSNEVSMLWQHVWRRRNAPLPCSIAATVKAPPSASHNTFASISGSDSGASAATGLQLAGSCTAATDSDGSGGLPQNSFIVSGGSRTSSAGSHLAALSAALLGDMPGCDLLSAPHRALFQPLGSKNHQAAPNSAFGTGCQPKPSFGASSLGSGQRRIALFRTSIGSPPLTSADLATSSGSTAAAAATSSGGDVAVSMDATPSQHDDALSNAACSLASLASCPPEQLEALRAFSGSLFGQPPSPSGDLSIAPLDVTPLQPLAPPKQRTVFSAPPQRPQHRLRTPAAPSQPRANSARKPEPQHQAAIGRAGGAHSMPPPQMPASYAASAADAAAASKADAKAACAAHRRAAILKFKQKREQRSFDKKVRYVSRKRLAESRPRVRGQFVKAEVAAACRTLAAAQQAEAEKGSRKAVAVAAQ